MQLTLNCNLALVANTETPKTSSQSGEIFGILENMLDTFNADLKTAEEEEAAAVQQFTELKKLKEEQIARDTEQLGKENEKFAAATTKLADSEATKADCEDSLEKDTQLLYEMRSGGGKSDSRV